MTDKKDLTPEARAFAERNLPASRKPDAISRFVTALVDFITHINAAGSDLRCRVCWSWQLQPEEEALIKDALVRRFHELREIVQGFEAQTNPDLARFAPDYKRHLQRHVDLLDRLGVAY